MHDAGRSQARHLDCIFQRNASFQHDGAECTFDRRFSFACISDDVILELKYLSKAEYTEKKAQEQWDDAVEQINGYAVAPRVEALRQGTQLHKIIIQFCGWDMIKMGEV